MKQVIGAMLNLAAFVVSGLRVESCSTPTADFFVPAADLEVYWLMRFEDEDSCYGGHLSRVKKKYEKKNESRRNIELSAEAFSTAFQGFKIFEFLESLENQRFWY